MSYVPIQSLVDKQDTFEIVRDQIAAIISAESISQQALAVVAGEDPNLWKLNVYKERSIPWERFLNLDPETATAEEATPIVNVRYGIDTVDEHASDVVEKQKSVGLFYIDCYGYGFAQDDGGTGHIPGDLTAALESQRALRLVRNFLMSSTNTYLQLTRGVVWKRMPRERQTFQPEKDDDNEARIVASRLELEVWFKELSPQYEGQPLEELIVDYKYDADGAVIASVEFDYS